MKTLLVAFVALTLLGSGCIVVHRPHGRRAGVSARRCPPGQTASDGTCRARGHGAER